MISASLFLRFLLLGVLLFLLSACDGTVWNGPYPAADAGKNILYTAFTGRPKHLDPAQSYTEDEAAFTAQVYQPPLQYHYLKRPYTLIPFAAMEVPKPRYFDASGHPLSQDADPATVAYSVYDIHIRPGIRYQPHPAFALDAAGKPRYFDLSPAELAKIDTLADFKESGSRELTAADYVYQVKRLAHPHLHSPIFGLMSQYIVGLKDYAATLEQADKAKTGSWLDLNAYPLEGAQAVDRYTYRVKVKGKYPQFQYWLAMPFFAPIPWEADRFYAQPGLAEKNISLDWYPVGTGPYMLTENDPNRRMVLERNPNYGGETYPAEGEPEDRAAGLLADAGKPLPFIDKVVFTLEKETIPYWNKFLQGYYDASGISSDNFDQAVQISGGEARLTEDMERQGIQLRTSVATSDMYMGFNMLDPTVGGYTEKARKLRQAISIAVDFEEFISIFANGRGIAAQGPIPPGIFGYREGANPYVYDWVDGKPKRKSISYAKQLLAEAGYPGGRDAATGKPLLVYLDTTSTGLGSKSRVDWLQKQFQKIDVQLVVRATDWNRFQDKIRKGNAQLFFFGWNADYPDPENFLFLLNGPQSRAKSGGENSANYDNPEYNRLFERMKNMDNGPQRQALIDDMVGILRRDAPWIFGYHPKDFVLAHAWTHNRKPNQMANNALKYQRLDPALREKMRARWNHPVLWPLLLTLVLLGAAIVPAWQGYKRHEKATAR
jgi:ABC-type transport system substrate-binding protein